MDKFKFTYSAPTDEERREIESIKRRYETKGFEESKLDRLRSLDRRVKKIPLIVALTLGIVGTLIFGLGLTMILEWDLIVWGVLISVVGLVPITLAYPLHSITFRKNKERFSDEILRLSQELLNDSGGEN